MPAGPSRTAQGGGGHSPECRRVIQSRVQSHGGSPFPGAKVSSGVPAPDESFSQSPEYLGGSSGLVVVRSQEKARSMGK